MQLSVTGRHVAVGEALRRHVEAELAAVIDKYFGSAIETHVVFSREAHLIRAEIALHTGRNGIVVNADAAANDHHLAFDQAAERLAKQLRRRKRWVRDDHAQRHAHGDEPNRLEPGSR